MTDSIERQIELEKYCLDLGVTRYQKDRPMPWRDETGTNNIDECSLPPGKRLLDRALPKMVEGLQEYLDYSMAGRAGRRARAALILKELDLKVVAYMTTRHAINCLMKPMSAARVAIGIASKIEDHYLMQRMSTSPETMDSFWAAYHHGQRSTRSQKKRRLYLRNAARYHQMTGVDWDEGDKHKLGIVCLEVFTKVTGLGELRLRKKGRKTIYLWEPTDAAVEWLEDAHNRQGLLTPVHLPMLCEPDDWTSPVSGGYITPEIRRTTRLVKTTKWATTQELFSIDMPQVYDAVNALQRTPWRICKVVLDTACELWEEGSTLAGIPDRGEPDIPDRPSDIPTNVAIKDLPEDMQEALKRWKADAAKEYARHANQLSKRLTMAQQLWVGRMYRGEKKFWFPYCLDFRGRIYTIPSTVSPQGDDLSKAMLEFAEGKPLGTDGAYWLAVHLANSFGFDKAPLDERVQWVLEHEELILDSALKPTTGERWWAKGELPWQTLAACVSWAGYSMHGEEYVCHTPVGMDGSCSGLQHFSALLRDEIGGRAVNLTPGERSDIYQTVADKVEKLIADVDELSPWRGKVIRKIVKQPAMTYAYSVTRRGVREQIEAAMVKLSPERPYIDGLRNFEAANMLAPYVIKAIQGTVVAASRAMRWLQDVARAHSQAGLPLIWTSPAGLPVLQAETKTKSRRNVCWWWGKQIQFKLPTDTRVIDSRKQSSAIAPNFVHSLDAAHLMRTTLACVDNGIADFAMVHDSFGTHACQVSELNYLLRETFVDMYSGDVLADFAAQMPDEIEIPALPPKGKLDLDAVRQSDFFFS